MVGFSLFAQTTHNNGVSVGTGLYLPFYPISESYNEYPFLTNQLGYVHNLDIKANFGLNTGVTISLLRKITVLEGSFSTKIIVSSLYADIPILFTYKAKNRNVKLCTGPSLDFFILSKRNYLKYIQKNWSYIDEDGNIFEGEDIELYGKDAKIYNSISLNNKMPLSLGYMFAIGKQYSFNNGSSLDIMFNIHCLELVSFYGRNYARGRIVYPIDLSIIAIYYF